MKSITIFSILAICVSGLPLGSLLNGDLTDSLLGSVVGGVVIPGLPSDDLVTPLLEGVNVVGNSGDLLSPLEAAVGSALDINNLGLDKRGTNQPVNLGVIDVLLKGAVAASLGYPTHVKRDLSNALISRGISEILSSTKRDLLSNGIGGQGGTGVIGLAGNLAHVGKYLSFPITIILLLYTVRWRNYGR